MTFAIVDHVTGISVTVNLLVVLGPHKMATAVVVVIRVDAMIVHKIKIAAAINLSEDLVPAHHAAVRACAIIQEVNPVPARSLDSLIDRRGRNLFRKSLNSPSEPGLSPRGTNR